jgi:hypothetical protein
LHTGPESTIRVNLRKEAKLRKIMQEDFLKRWQKEYLLDLRSYHQVRRSKGRSTECRVGDIVLLENDQRPRHMWQRARIHEKRPGRDGKVRTVILRTANGTSVSRPVQLVNPVEIDHCGEDVEDSSPLLTTRNTTIFFPLSHFLPPLTFRLDREDM